MTLIIILDVFKRIKSMKIHENGKEESIHFDKRAKDTNTHIFMYNFNGNDYRKYFNT